MMYRSRAKQKCGTGFTLIEILATISMIALIIPVAMKGISIATALASDSKSSMQATNLAENRLAEILLDEEWQSSEKSGKFSDEYSSYSWQMDTSELAESNLKQVNVKVLWTHRGQERSITLSTLVYDAE